MPKDKAEAAQKEQNKQAEKKTESQPKQQTLQLAAKTTGDQPEAFYHAIRGKNLENLIYIDLKYGRVVVELLPDLAPRHC